MDDGKRTAAEERDSYRYGYERDATAWRSRITALEAEGKTDGDPAFDRAKEGLENALIALAAFDKSKRPAKARESR